jgi:hypothetical protein
MGSLEMQNNSYYLPGFHLPTLRRRPRSASQLLADERAQLKKKTLSELGECFRQFIPTEPLEQSDSGHSSRRRLFTKENTFWAFFSQVLDADRGCRAVVRKLQAVCAAQSKPLPSSSTAAYCQARARLESTSLERIFSHTAQQGRAEGDPYRLNGRRVVVVDGTGLSMPDTASNQQAWPQQANQKPGCGFPQATACACFCLDSGTLLSYRLGNKKNHELPLLRDQWGTFEPGDIFLGDKGFCSYYDVWAFQEQGVDSVITLARRTPVTEAEAVKVLGDNDRLIRWPKPVHRQATNYSHAQWEDSPDALLLRQIKVTVEQSGFRVTTFYIVTTLLDPQIYPASEIAELYLQRWDVELFFRDIKTTMGMDILRCKTPAMVRKEILMTFIAYNGIRRLMSQAAREQNLPLQRISFKGSIQALRHWEAHLTGAKNNRADQARLRRLLIESIADNATPHRPGRREPRVRKRRPKNYQLMTAPRHEMNEAPHRSRYRANQA